MDKSKEQSKRMRYSKDKDYLFSDIKSDKSSNKVIRIQTCDIVGKKIVPRVTYKDYLKNAYLYRSAYTGLTHARRDVVVADIDRNYEMSIDDTLSLLVEWGIQVPNCIVINRRLYEDRTGDDQSHYQMIWFVDEPWFGRWNRWEGDGRKSYNWVTRKLNEILGGDKGFKGAYYKNPYCDDGQETIWLSDVPLPRKKLESYLRYKTNDTSWMEGLKSESRRGLERIGCGGDVKDTTLLESMLQSHYFEELSRNTIAHDFACRKGLGYMCRNNGNPPTTKMVKEWVIKAEEMVAKRSGKDGIESSDKIASTVRSVCAYIESVYNPSFETDNLNAYDMERAEQGRRTQKVLSIINRQKAHMLVEMGEVTYARELTGILDVKLCTAREYLRTPNKDDEDRSAMNDWFFDYMGASSSDKERMKDSIVEIFNYKGWEFSEFDYSD